MRSPMNADQAESKPKKQAVGNSYTSRYNFKDLLFKFAKVNMEYGVEKCFNYLPETKDTMLWNHLLMKMTMEGSGSIKKLVQQLNLHKSRVIKNLKD
jgi:hypothetical protein